MAGCQGNITCSDPRKARRAEERFIAREFRVCCVGSRVDHLGRSNLYVSMASVVVWQQTESQLLPMAHSHVCLLRADVLIHRL